MGLEANVTATRTRIRAGDEHATHSIEANYRLSLEPVDDDLRLRFDDLQMGSFGPHGPPPPSRPTELMAILVNIVPDYVVTREGDFVGMHDLTTLQADLERLFSMLGRAGGETPEVRLAFDMLRSEPVLEGNAEDQWDALVGFWVGANLEWEGAEPARIDVDRERSPDGLPGAVRYFGVSRRTPCSRSGVVRDCVELEMRRTADSEETRLAANSMMSMIGAMLGGKQSWSAAGASSLELENLVQLVTEPESLIPHSYTWSKTVRGTEEGKLELEERTDKLEVLFSYP
ncbi:MAG TPA: hypothetical protein VNB06_00715 [Thermoanaerobaculia bacterium]|nr:hypothetical protein [Thermoanaerobaculia bacterium]